jgi:hypothetical protein
MFSRLVSHEVDLRDIWYWGLLSVAKFQILLKSDKNIKKLSTKSYVDLL